MPLSRAQKYDVVVVGGGSAGTAAAVAAARIGARTLLGEAAGFLGGAATLRNVLTYCGLYTLGPKPRSAVGGVAREVVARLTAIGAVTGPKRFRGVFVVFDPEAVKRVLDGVVTEAGVDVLLHALAIGAERDGDAIRSVTVQDRNGPHAVEARAFVDATGDGDLACFAGASTRYGNDGFVNMGTLGARFGGIPREVPVSAARWAEAIRAAKARGVAPLSKETGLVVRLPISADVVAYLIGEEYDARDAASIGAAEMRGRRQAWTYLEVIRGIAGHENAYLVSTGPEFGTRESRHIDAVYQVTAEDLRTGARFADCVALGAWASEFHNAATPDSSFEKPPRETYDIPLRALMSRDVANLFAAGRTADGDRIAGASMRVMGTAFATGHAAGVAAAQLAANGSVSAPEVRKALAAQGALLDAENLPEPVQLGE
jgi:FAD dependent oxidoreductase